jgi:hypothetical protein
LQEQRQSSTLSHNLYTFFKNKNNKPTHIQTQRRLVQGEEKIIINQLKNKKIEQDPPFPEKDRTFCFLMLCPS